MYFNQFNINGISLTGVSISDGRSTGQSSKNNDINIVNETRNEKVKARGQLTISGSNLAQGVKAGKNIDIKNATIGSKTISKMGKIQAEHSNFLIVKARDGIKLTDCTTQDIRVTMGGLIASNSRFPKLKVRDTSNLNACNGGTIKISMGVFNSD